MEKNRHDKNKWFEKNEYIDAIFVDDIPSFGIAKPNPDASYKDFSKYIVEQKQEYDQTLINEVLKLMIDETKHYPKFDMIAKNKAMDICANDKSPGFPLCMKYGSKKQAILGEYEYFNNLDEMIVSNPNFQDYVLVADKVEVRPTEKLEQNKIRTFCAKSLEHFYISTLIYEEMLDYFSNRHPLETNFMLGWTPYYGSWHDLMTFFSQWSHHVDRDFEKFDGKLRCLFHQLHYLYLKSMMNPTNVKMHQLHKWAIFSSMNVIAVMPDGHMYMIYDFGNASGGKLTFFFNCFVNKFIHIYVFKKRGVKISDSLQLFGGDDSHLGFHQEPLDFTNDFLELGFPSTYKVYQDIMEVDFMGYQNLSFIYNGKKRFVFCPDKQKLAYSFCVIKNSQTPLQYFDKLCTLYTLLAFHNEYRDKLLYLIQDYYSRWSDHDPLYTTYYERVRPVNEIYEIYHAPINHAALINQRIKLYDNNYQQYAEIFEPRQFLRRKLERWKEPTFHVESPP